MRAGGITAAVAVLVLAASCGAASAQSPYNYPWCLYYMGGRDGGTSCYFTSYEQCMDSARGNGAYCAPNPQYRGPAQPAPARTAPPQHYRHRRHHHY